MKHLLVTLGATVLLAAGPAHTQTGAREIAFVAERKEVARLKLGDGPKHIAVARVPAPVLAAFRARR